jgi:hypothetical protein
MSAFHAGIYPTKIVALASPFADKGLLEKGASASLVRFGRSLSRPLAKRASP